MKRYLCICDWSIYKVGQHKSSDFLYKNGKLGEEFALKIKAVYYYRSIWYYIYFKYVHTGGVSLSFD